MSTNQTKTSAKENIPTTQLPGDIFNKLSSSLLELSSLQKEYNVMKEQLQQKNLELAEKNTELEIQLKERCVLNEQIRMLQSELVKKNKIS
jgi:chromosome segregation ATPase